MKSHIATTAALAGLVFISAEVRAQSLRSRADSLAVIAAATTFASHDMLVPFRRYVLALESFGSHSSWDPDAGRMLARLIDARGASTTHAVLCRADPRACAPDATTDIVIIGRPSAQGDSAYVEIGVTKATGSSLHPFVTRSNQYVLIKRGQDWAVDHVQLRSIMHGTGE